MCAQRGRRLPAPSLRPTRRPAGPGPCGARTLQEARPPGHRGRPPDVSAAPGPACPTAAARRPPGLRPRPRRSPPRPRTHAGTRRWPARWRRSCRAPGTTRGRGDPARTPRAATAPHAGHRPRRSSSPIVRQTLRHARHRRDRPRTQRAPRLSPGRDRARRHSAHPRVGDGVDRVADRRALLRAAARGRPVRCGRLAGDGRRDRTPRRAGGARRRRAVDAVRRRGGPAGGLGRRHGGAAGRVREAGLARPVAPAHRRAA